MKKIVLSLLFILLTLSACGTKSEVISDEAIIEEKVYDQEYANYGISVTNKQNDRKIIVTGDISINCTNIQNVVEMIDELVIKYDAYVISNYENNYNNSYYAGMSVRIPADKFNDFVNDLKIKNNITDLSINSDDITDTYIDSESRLSNLKIQEKRLLEILEKAETISDIISIESELTNVRSDIEYYEKIIKNYDKQIEYSILNINISSSEKGTSYSFTSKIKDALSNTFVSFINVLQTIIVFLIYAIPYIIIIIVIIIIIKKIKKKNN